jgi:MoxR-like ATPase
MQAEKTKSQAAAGEIVAYLRSRTPLIWIKSTEEARVERYLVEAAASAAYIPRTWDVGNGICDMAGTVQSFGGPDPGDAFNAIRERAVSGPDRGLWIMRDLPAWLAPPVGLTSLRQLRNLARMLPTIPKDRAQAIIIISPSGDIPPELANHATVIEWPIPDREEIAQLFDASLEALPDKIREGAAPNGTRDAAIDAAMGLTGEEASACFARSLVQLRKIDPVTVAKEKKRVVAREGVLEWYDPLPGGLESVGGLDNLKLWIKSRSAAYTPAAREYGLVAPKGALVVGVSGTGKSLTAKATATEWGVPLLKMDLGALKSKFVGESEANLRKAFGVIEAIGRCVLWVDEIEKSLQGATSGAADGGVSADALGALLNFMQERRGEAFIIATANDIESLPPELLRKGRFDEIWWVDLPTIEERAEILKAALRTHGRDPAKLDIDIEAIAGRWCEGFTGAEIAALVPEALFAAFADSAREITTRDLIRVAETVVPLGDTAKEKIAKLRAWARGRARPATATLTEIKTPKAKRVLDI